MKTNIFLGLTGSLLTMGMFMVPQAHALSCLPTDMYFKDIIGKEEVVVFTGTPTDRITEKNYTAEVIAVKEVKQGYVEENIFVYHQKDETWGYLCNAGPHEKEQQEGVYVATRDANGKYLVAQRLDTNSPLIVTLFADLKKAEITGEVVELSKTDRMNQILTTIEELYEQIKTLFAEYKYWIKIK
jgi:hypothetical protein